MNNLDSDKTLENISKVCRGLGQVTAGDANFLAFDFTDEPAS